MSQASTVRPATIEYRPTAYGTGSTVVHQKPRSNGFFDWLMGAASSGGGGYYGGWGGSPGPTVDSSLDLSAYSDYGGQVASMYEDLRSEQKQQTEDTVSRIREAFSRRSEPVSLDIFMAQQGNAMRGSLGGSGGSLGKIALVALGIGGVVFVGAKFLKRKRAA